ncbi:protein of unknown function [Vibrio tapetis subsp. tapetis]|uniref:Uncharacterized protein n=1 Tax=Vibrio tapetis subsp. tapetis TaxID=1671868 RepID=A0A2N8ZJC4_9VIBR|nr:protein of unknown function [Vibrio tapetis subsp. tapetis]
MRYVFLHAVTGVYSLTFLKALLGAEQFFVTFIGFRPEIDIELSIVTEFNAMPILWRAGGKLASLDDNGGFRLGGFGIGKAIISYGAFHDAYLTKDPFSGVVMGE